LVTEFCVAFWCASPVVQLTCCNGQLQEHDSRTLQCGHTLTSNRAWPMIFKGLQLLALFG
jgi:hypothetical protein